jgi:hypothetical protein
VLKVFLFASRGRQEESLGCCRQFLLLLLGVLGGVGFELRTLHFSESRRAKWTPLVHFALVILEMGSHQLLA